MFSRFVKLAHVPLFPTTFVLRLLVPQDHWKTFVGLEGISACLPVKPCKINWLFSKLRGSHRQRVISVRSQVFEKWVTVINNALIRTFFSQTIKFHYRYVTSLLNHLHFFYKKRFIFILLAILPKSAWQSGRQLTVTRLWINEVLGANSFSRPLL